MLRHPQLIKTRPTMDRPRGGCLCGPVPSIDRKKGVNVAVAMSLVNRVEEVYMLQERMKKYKQGITKNVIDG
ncbi:unnamed protein product [Boreogadus saida]